MNLNIKQFGKHAKERTQSSAEPDYKIDRTRVINTVKPTGSVEKNPRKFHGYDRSEGQNNY